MANFFNQLLAYVQVHSSDGDYTLTIGSVILLLGSSIVLSALIMGIYWFTHRNSIYHASMIITILALGPIVSVIVLGVGSNLARAISIGGGLALIRFRNTVSDPKDMIYMYLSVAAGMACGIGYWGFALMAVILIGIILIIANLTKLDTSDNKVMKLKITVPESLNFAGVFDSILAEYCKSYHLDKVSTADYGTLMELTYRVKINDLNNQKELIDKIREKNGNMNISLAQSYSAD